MDDLKEIRKKKCSTRGCKDKADNLINRKYYCGYCRNRIRNKDYIKLNFLDRIKNKSKKYKKNGK